LKEKAKAKRERKISLSLKGEDNNDRFKKKQTTKKLEIQTLKYNVSSLI
jgi:hypothetical protein